MAEPRVPLKIVVVGDGACGKTCLLTTFNTGRFPHNTYIPTVFDLCIKDVDHQGRTVELSLWDTAGQEDYDRLRTMAYPDTDVVLVCFSVDLIDSLENTFEKWLPEVARCAPQAKVLLVALKIDLRADQEAIGHMARVYQRGPVSSAEGRRVAARLGLPYIECSAKRSQHVGDVFHKAIALVLPDTQQPSKPASASCCSIL
ncbi:hypothetical protein GGI25_003599 [Coemansia spiralis]|uniref:Uncharacterized protein n=2 Tax=Coemansia TaxID=4863 RepID=A0A9W8KXF5_9FUNG|nr:Rho-related GTP-binding protein RhoB precursor [Coemansia spiralis]KAJ1991154.1 hypothetical protein EDC05_003632 [Coemansia umbellata]KAJ2621268.1 hypothetical protein GGI26_004242 [Coemansia sp. RSA 1358]KAJ2676449.1 hypothetical protein GGI25_003599 [Coemansia spiralis]